MSAIDVAVEFEVAFASRDETGTFPSGVIGVRASCWRWLCAVSLTEASSRFAGLGGGPGDCRQMRANGPPDTELDALHDQYTKEALAAGVFGAPSYVLPSGEIFWGQDRLELLERALKQLA